VATNIEEEEQLEELFRRALENGVQELRLLGRNEVKKIEPNIRVEAAILSGSTGIVDTHSLMKKMADIFQDNDGIIAYDTELIGIEKDSGGFELAVNDRREGAFKFFTRRLVNCAGLFADKISALSGLAKEEYRIKYCKGDYFRLSPAKSRLISHLVYPVPKSNAGLGVHATLDLAGSVRLGPDDEYVDRIYYDVDPSKADLFAQSASLFMPFVKPDDLSPDTSGIRPKLQGPNEGFRDFVIREESDNGFPGLVNLIGIESPGLTASLAIAGIVNTLF
jgi:L-2-hydroxyglutarate oxidase LhgO